MTPDQISTLESIAADVDSDDAIRVSPKLMEDLSTEVFGKSKTDTTVRDYLFSPEWKKIDNTPDGLVARIRYVLSVEKAGVGPSDVGFTDKAYKAQIRPYKS